MTTIEQEQAAPVRGETGWEARPVPVDFKVGYQMDPEADPDDPVTIEAYWDGEAKVVAEIDNYDGVSNIDKITRPSHWGEDSRPAHQQKPEYILGMDGIVSELTRSFNNPIEINNQKGVVAEALLVLKAPVGWKKTTKLVSSNTWTEYPVVSYSEAVTDGGVISVRYEQSPSPNPGLGYLAIESTRAEPYIQAA